jgi:hypothetical protein
LLRNAYLIIRKNCRHMHSHSNYINPTFFGNPKISISLIFKFYRSIIDFCHSAIRGNRSLLEKWLARRHNWKLLTLIKWISGVTSECKLFDPVPIMPIHCHRCHRRGQKWLFFRRTEAIFAKILKVNNKYMRSQEIFFINTQISLLHQSWICNNIPSPLTFLPLSIYPKKKYIYI